MFSLFSLNSVFSQVTGILGDLRILFGHGAIEPYVKEMLVEGKLLYKEFFTASLQWWHMSDGDIKEEPTVWCHDLMGLLNKVAEERGVSVASLLHLIGLDSGQGFLQLIIKVALV